MGCLTLVAPICRVLRAHIWPLPSLLSSTLGARLSTEIASVFYWMAPGGGSQQQWSQQDGSDAGEVDFHTTGGWWNGWGDAVGIPAMENHRANAKRVGNFRKSFLLSRNWSNTGALCCGYHVGARASDLSARAQKCWWNVYISINRTPLMF